MSALPIATATTEQEVGTFLLNETNRAFLLGACPHPDIPSPGYTPILLSAALNLFLTDIDFGLPPAMVAVRIAALVLLAANVARTGYDHYRRSLRGQVCRGVVVDYAQQPPASRLADDPPLVMVAFEFRAPGGVVLSGYAEGESRFATRPHAPLPGTPILVWFVSDEAFWLL